MACCGTGKTTSRDNPVLLGEANGLLYRCRLNLNVYGLRVNTVQWFSGDGVTARIAAGVLVTVP